MLFVLLYLHYKHSQKFFGSLTCTNVFHCKSDTLSLPSFKFIPIVEDIEADHASINKLTFCGLFDDSPTNSSSVPIKLIAITGTSDTPLISSYVCNPSKD